MAKRFKFTLQPVLEKRERIEDRKQLVVAQRKRALDEAECELSRLNGDFARHSDALRSQHRGLEAEQLRLHYAHLQYLDRVILAQIRLVADRFVALERARKELFAASRDRKVVEKLKERRRESFLAEELRHEQNELDDANARRLSRAQFSTGGFA